MQRRLLLPLALIGVLVLGLQLLVPPWAEDKVEDRLTERGGTADVDLSAFPAPRLLWKHGDSLRVRGSGYRLPLGDPGVDVFDEIDGFDEVDVALSNFRAGPFAVESFRLRRGEDDEDYELELAASASARDLSEYAGGELGGALGSFFGGLAAGALPGGNEQVDVDLTATMVSDADGAHATDVEGTVLGVPAGPLAEALAGAIASRL